ncbi:LacI family DNA-binding transcriptional regulator [Kribbella sp. NPDC000426]|uniref:LacI family DNA-binding transcriptional regulator n=1 Tax=Kribbella sp. NPDC000426 TaxID=3154255 RepID=UPI00332CCC3C
MTSRRVTLVDVAEAAGVSRTAVSLVLSGRGSELRISTEVQQRIRRTAEELRYRPNAVSQNLRTGTTRTIGFVSDTVATSRLAGDMIKGALEAAREQGFLLFIGETEGDHDLERELLQAMADRQVEGIILAYMYTQRVAVPPGMDATRSVLLNALPQSPAAVPSVIPDEVEAGRTVARILLDAGHRDGIHLIGAGPGVADIPPGGVAAFERLQGMREVFDAAGVEISSGKLCREWLPPDGHRATRALLRRTRPKALVCFNDRLALGVYQAIEDAGLSVPTEVSVISFDDHPIASWIRPKLTTIALPHYDLGRTAVDLLLASEESSPGTVVRVPMLPRLRDSVAPPSA